MKDFLILLMYLLTTVGRFLGPGGARAIVAGSLLMKQQLLVVNRSRRRAPNFSVLDRFLFGFWSLFLNPRRIQRAAMIIRPSTLLKFHDILKKRKYRQLYSAYRKGKPGPKGPSRELIQAVVELKQRNPRFGCLRIAQQINHAFGLGIDKDVVRCILEAHYHPSNNDGGASWLTFPGHTKDSLWSIDLFRCESILLKSHWVLVIMDQFTRRIIGFGVHAGDVDGITLCRMFNTTIFCQGTPHSLSADNDPLFRFHQWQANLRILEIEEIKSIPYIPISHPFIERLIGTIRRKYLDRVFFWNDKDLEKKLEGFCHYYNRHRVHQSLTGDTPAIFSGDSPSRYAEFSKYSWASHCCGLFQIPHAA